MSEYNFDIVILGGGSAGYSTAIRALELGLSAVIIEKEMLGGTCLHKGCVPTKAMLHAAEIADSVKEADKYGIAATLHAIDINAVSKHREEIITKKHKGLQGLLKARKVEVVYGQGKLISTKSVQVNGDIYTGKNIVLATGSYSKTLPGIEIKDRVITSEHALELDFIPKKVLILGGGVIGVEFASVWKSFGSEVTIIEGLNHLVPNEEESISKQLEKAFKRRGINFSLGNRFESVTQDANSVTVKLENGEIHTGDILLVAVGRGPATSGLGYEEQGINIDRGYVITNENLETNVPGIYAAGDIVPGLQLAHRGYQHGIFLAEYIAGKNPSAISDQNIPKITYCEPEIASVGLSSSKAAELYGLENINKYEYNLAGNAKSEILGTSGTITVIREKNGPVLGVHMIGSRVGELIGEAQLIVSWEAHPEDVAPLIHAHPTQNESLAEAMLYLANKPLHTM